MKTQFIADLHLTEEQKNITQLFLTFLKTCGRDVDALYILGDLFEVWIGDDDSSAFHAQIKAALRQATENGLSIYLMHGNRDFLIGKKFMRDTGCRLLTDPCVINLYGVSILLMHGDTLCTQDMDYLKFRKKARNCLLQRLFLWKSLKKRRAIAAKMREVSRQHTSTTPDYIMDVTQNEVVRVMKKYQVQYLIHGHTHRPAMHEFTIDNQDVTRIVLGPWHEHGSALDWNQDGKKTLMEWKI
ncbi:MAG: UDP-2,3-diacylglucosamine diphosphatase [Gammaproteobacteria bacterium RIFCSPHIGHO2_12_FULL_42_13]|nr:MAG: UDP-2,3-diacylglucosamine diphosphatase [Gammaproteobacteria bacterium RIFCSPHIGHO2_12_FULL_42_13]